MLDVVTGAGRVEARKSVDRSKVRAEDDSMGHDSSAQDTDADIECTALHYVMRRQIAMKHVGPVRLDSDEQDDEASQDGKDERGDESFQQPKASVGWRLVDEEDDDNIDRGDQDTRPQWQCRKEEIESDGRSGQLCELCGHDGTLSDDIEWIEERPSAQSGARDVALRRIAEPILFENEHTALSCQVGVGNHTDAAREDLNKDGEATGEQDDEEKRIPKFGACLQVGGPVARVSIGDRSDDAGAEKVEVPMEDSENGSPTSSHSLVEGRWPRCW